MGYYYLVQFLFYPNGHCLHDTNHMWLLFWHIKNNCWTEKVTFNKIEKVVSSFQYYRMTITWHVILCRWDGLCVLARHTVRKLILFRFFQLFSQSLLARQFFTDFVFINHILGIRKTSDLNIKLDYIFQTQWLAFLWYFSVTIFYNATPKTFNQCWRQNFIHHSLSWKNAKPVCICIVPEGKLTHLQCSQPKDVVSQVHLLKLIRYTHWLFRFSLISWVPEFLCSFGNSIVGCSCFSYTVILPHIP